MALSNEEIVSIMANDLNKEVLVDGRLKVKLCGFQYSGYPRPIIRNQSTWEVRCVNDLSLIKLLRTPLSQMSEKKILKLCNAASESTFGYSRYSKWKVIPQYATEGKSWDYVEVKNERSDYVFGISLVTGEVRIYDNNGDYEPTLIEHTYWQWYQRERVDIPLYPWNKTAIELNLAVSSNLDD